MKIQIIIENNPDPQEKYLSEHGLSVYFEFANSKILLDTGQSANFLANFTSAGISVEDIDHVIVSHGHYDHAGGLEYFIEKNKKAQIHLSEGIFEQAYFSSRSGKKRNIGIRFSPAALLDRCRFIAENTEILPGLHVIKKVANTYPLPKANRQLFKQANGKASNDDFRHEISVVCQHDGVHVFTGCAHKGILNILSTVGELFGNQNIRTVIGGFHLPDDNSHAKQETDEELSAIAQVLQTEYTNARYFTGHCTGEKKFSFLKKLMSERIHRFYSGYTIETNQA